MAETANHCLALLKDENSRLYPPLLFLPEERRGAVAALYAFHLEIERIAYVVSEPLPGEIRLQWWREVLVPENAVDRSGEADANPLARELLAVIKEHDLPVAGFDRYLEAREFDLYNDVLPDRTSLEAYFGETESFILQMAAMICGVGQGSDLADACGHGGVAIGIARRLETLAIDRSAQRIYLPGDLLTAAGLERETWLAKADERHVMAIAAYRALGMEHAAKAKAAIARLDKTARGIFLPLALANQTLQKAGDSAAVMRGQVETSPLRQQFALWKAAALGI